MDSCEDVIIACGLYLLSEEKQEKGKILDSQCVSSKGRKKKEKTKILD
jgi:hypothetical protein